MHLPFETDRLRLRAFRAEDVATFSAYRSEPEVARYQGWSAPFPLEKARTFINKMMAKTLGQPGEWYQIAIERKEDGQMMGDCTYYLADDNRQAEIGFTLAGAFQGQGYAREAVACLIAYLFDDLQVHRVFANVDPANDASIRLLTHLGFRCEGCFRQSMWLKGEWVDEQWYAMLREEWLAARDKGEKSG